MEVKKKKVKMLINSVGTKTNKESTKMIIINSPKMKKRRTKNKKERERKELIENKLKEIWEILLMMKHIIKEKTQEVDKI